MAQIGRGFISQSPNQKSPIQGVSTVLLILNNQVTLNLTVCTCLLKWVSYLRIPKCTVGKKTHRFEINF